MSDQKKLAQALPEFQGDIKSVPFDKVNPHYKSKYSSLDAVWSMLRPILNSHGFSIIQSTYIDGDMIMLKTGLVYLTGESVESIYPVAKMSLEPQKMGSALTYARRYSICTLCGLTSDDDDDANITKESPQKPYYKLLSAEQETLIRELAGERLQGLLKHYGVPSLDKLDSRYFDEAVSLLQKKYTKGE